MRATDFITERQVPSIRGQILDAVHRDGGKAGEYFVRFTDIDKIGFSDQQKFKRHLDVDAPEFTTSGIGNIIRQQGRRALWFYPLREYLKQSMQGQYAMDFPYVWLVRIRPDAWLQPVGPSDRRVIQPAPRGKRRVGLLKGGISPQGVFFEPAFDVIARFYDYAGQHQRHGQVQGRPEPTFFDRVRGDT